MPFVLLISDFNNNSFKPGLLKTEILQKIPDLLFIDITHQIRLNNIIEAAFVIRQTMRQLRFGNILLVKIGSVRQMLVYPTESGLFILPDNGLISMVFDTVNSKKLYSIKPGNEAEAIQLYTDKRIDQLPLAGPDFEIRRNKPLQISGNIAAAECIFTDGHGNCYFNISEQEFRTFAGSRDFSIRIQHYTGHVFSFIGRHIEDVQPGEAIFRFSSGSYLKLQINQGSAKQLFRIKDDTKIIIELT